MAQSLSLLYIKEVEGRLVTNTREVIQNVFPYAEPPLTHIFFYSMQLSEVNPIVSSNLGWDLDAAQDGQMVTFVKKSIVFSEITLSKSEYLKMMDETFPEEYYHEKIEF